MEIPTPPSHPQHFAGYILAILTSVMFLLARTFHAFGLWFVSPVTGVVLQNCSYCASVVIALLALFKLFIHRKKPKL